MEPETPPAPQPPPEPARAPGTGQPPPIEVRAEPVPPGERGRVVDAPRASDPGASSAPPPGGATGSGSGASAEPAWRKNGWAIACHLIGLIDLGLTSVPGVIASLVVWLIKKDEDPEVDFHGKEAINFQITLLIAFAAGLVLTPCLIGIPVLLALPLVKLVLMSMAAVRAANGERWRYPASLRLLR